MVGPPLYGVRPTHRTCSLTEHDTLCPTNMLQNGVHETESLSAATEDLFSQQFGILGRVPHHEGGTKAGGEGGGGLTHAHLASLETCCQREGETSCGSPLWLQQTSSFCKGFTPSLAHHGPPMCGSHRLGGRKPASIARAARASVPATFAV